MTCNKSNRQQTLGHMVFVILLFFSLPMAGNADNIKASVPMKSPEAAGAVAVLPEEAKISEKIFGLKGLSNAGRVAPGIYRGAQPLPEGYVTLRQMGIKTVINLRSRHSKKKAVEAAGMKSIEIPFGVLRDVKMDKVNEVVEMMVDPYNQPVYVHCKLGQDRTGIIIAAYRMKVEDWSLKDAEAEMHAFGFNDLWHELKEFIREYAKSVGR